MNKFLSTLGFRENESSKEIAEGLVYGFIVAFIVVSFILSLFIPS